MYWFLNHKKVVVLLLLLLTLFCREFITTRQQNHAFAGVILGGEDEPTPPGGGGGPGLPTVTPGGPTITPTPTSSTGAVNTPTPTPEPPTNTPTPGGPTNTPPPEATNTPTSTIAPTVTPNLTPCPQAAPCAVPTKIPTPTPIFACGQGCIVGANNQCPQNQQCMCATANCPAGSNGVCANPYCSSYTAQANCQCTDCKCDASSCDDTSTNPGKVITIPRITPIENPIGPACHATCEEYVVNGVVKDCDELLTPQPVEFKQADGNSCKTYTIQVTSNGETCSCNSQVCCPTCEDPKVVPGYEAGCAACNFETQIDGNSETCPCSGAEISFQSSQSGCVEFGNGERQCGEPGDPPKVTYGNAGFYDVTFSCRASDGSTQVCKKEVVVGCDCQSTNPTPTGEPTPSPTLGPWFKLKNASYSRQTALVNRIPDPVESFDGGLDDLVCDNTLLTNYRCMLSQEAGVELVAGLIDLNNAPVSHRGWKQANSTFGLDMSPASFKEYVKAKKKYKIITQVDLDNFIPDVTLTSDKIYIFDDPNVSLLTFTDGTFQGQTQPFVLVVTGSVNIDKNIVSLATVSSAIVISDTLQISTNVTRLDGIYFTNILDFTYDTPTFPNPLKINGNIIAYQPTDTMIKRINDPINRPGIFVDYKIGTYLDIWPLLTIKESNQQEEIQ